MPIRELSKNAAKTSLAIVALVGMGAVFWSVHTAKQHQTRLDEDEARQAVERKFSSIASFRRARFLGFKTEEEMLAWDRSQERPDRLSDAQGDAQAQAPQQT